MFKIRGMGDGIIALHLHKNAKLLSKRKPSLRDPPVVAHCGRFVMLHWDGPGTWMCQRCHWSELTVNTNVVI
jgi:hypothetical protein